MTSYTGLTKDWHYKGGKDGYCLEIVEQFHNKFVLSPERLNEVTNIYKYIIDTIVKDNCDICKEFKESGSSHEGAKIKGTKEADDYEFDVMIILRHPDLIMEEELADRSGYANAVYKEQNISALDCDFIKSCLTPGPSGETFFDAAETSNGFLGKLQKWINKKPIPEYSFQLFTHGPAIQMDVKRKNEETRIFSVDIAPTIEIEVVPASGQIPSEKKRYDRYVAKPEKKRTPDSVTWFKVTKLNPEYSSIDQGSICHMCPTVGRQHMESLNVVTPLMYPGFTSGAASTATVDCSRYESIPDALMTQLKDELTKAFLGVRQEHPGKEHDAIKRILVIDMQFEDELEQIPVPKKPSYAWLRPRGELKSPSDRLQKTLKYSYLAGGKYLDINSEVKGLIEILEQCFHNNQSLRDKISIRRCDRMISLIAHPEGSDPNVHQRVDLIPAVLVGQDIYITLPEDFDDIPDTKAWRLTYAYEEVEAVSTSPENLKKVYRIMKALTQKEPGLAQLTSYHLKNVFLSLKEELAWENEPLHILLIRVLLKLQIYLKNTNLPAYFLPHINLLKNMSSDCIIHMSNRTEALLNKEGKMIKAIGAWKNKDQLQAAIKDTTKNEEMSHEYVQVQSLSLESALPEFMTPYERGFEDIRMEINCQLFGFDFRSLVVQNVYQYIKVVMLNETEPQDYDVMMIVDQESRSTPRQSPKAAAEYVQQELQKRISSVRNDLILSSEEFKIILKDSNGFCLNILPAYRDGDKICGSNGKYMQYMPMKNKVWKAFQITDCGKRVLRVFEILQRRSHNALDLLTRDMLRSALFWEMEEQSDWSEEKEAERLTDVLERINDFLKDRMFPDYFKPSCNFLFSHSLDSIELGLTQAYVQSLCENQGASLLQLLRSN